MTVGYAICFIAAVGLAVAYLLMVKEKEFWLTMLYISIAVVNLGYLLISIANTVLLFAILLLGYFFPGNPSPNGLPWFVWAAIGEVIAMAVATITIFVIVQKKDKQLKERRDNE